MHSASCTASPAEQPGTTIRNSSPRRSNLCSSTEFLHSPDRRPELFFENFTALRPAAESPRLLIRTPLKNYYDCRLECRPSTQRKQQARRDSETTGPRKGLLTFSAISCMMLPLSRIVHRLQPTELSA